MNDDPGGVERTIEMLEEMNRRNATEATLSRIESLVQRLLAHGEKCDRALHHEAAEALSRLEANRKEWEAFFRHLPTYQEPPLPPLCATCNDKHVIPQRGEFSAWERCPDCVAEDGSYLDRDGKRWYPSGRHA